MSTHPLPPTGQGPTDPEMEAAAELRVRELCQLANDHLQDITGEYPQMDDLLRLDATRLFHLCHTITNALAHHDIARAYAIAQGDEVGGESLGVAI